MAKNLMLSFMLGTFFIACGLNALILKSKESSELYLDGEKSTVYFNDGDTFRVLEGSKKGERVRVTKYNTLETFPIHQWADFSKEELYKNAQEATMEARRGVWHCQSEKEKDIYGRMLAKCDDLAIFLIERGLAHSYSVDENPADRNYLRSQRKAQSALLGMWKKGKPNYIITSLHSADEDDNKMSRKTKKVTYNRIISADDGHTKRWQHENIYKSCENVCLADEKSCMIYVPFKERYGNKRPDCLR